MRHGSHRSRALGLETFAEPFPGRNAHPCRKREPLFSDLVLNRQEQRLCCRCTAAARGFGPSPAAEPSARGLGSLGAGTWPGLRVSPLPPSEETRKVLLGSPWPADPPGPARPLLSSAPQPPAWVTEVLGIVITSQCPALGTVLEGDGKRRTCPPQPGLPGPGREGGDGRCGRLLQRAVLAALNPEASRSQGGLPGRGGEGLDSGPSVRYLWGL